MMLGSPGPVMMRGMGDKSITRQNIRPGTLRRIFPYTKPYRWGIALLVVVGALDAVITAATPLLLKIIVDNGIVNRDTALVLGLAGVVAGLALLDAFFAFAQRLLSARIGERLIYDLRT